MWGTHCSPKAAEVCTGDLFVDLGEKSERLETGDYNTAIALEKFIQWDACVSHTVPRQKNVWHHTSVWRSRLYRSK